jgi:hydroxymethylbilane synthase
LEDGDTVKIGTRGSPLALAQARMVAAGLAQASNRPDGDFPLEIIKTTGDLTQDRALADIGGKGLFTKEIDQAQLAGSIDISVHSSKDLPTELPEGLVVAGYLPREDVRDAFIGRDGRRLGDLPQGAIVGTVSLRRQALLRRMRPDLKIVILRGNVGTRLKKVADGEVDGTLLALAGLKRLGLQQHVTEVLGADVFPPAVGQAAIAVVTRAGDRAANELVGRIVDLETGIAITAERALLKALDGSCRMPIAGHASLRGNMVQLRGMVLSPDGRHVFELSQQAPVAEAATLGARLGAELRSAIPDDIYALLKS